MDERGMENEHLDQRNSSNTEYLPTKCRVTKPPPPKPATNPLQFIKVAPPPLFQKAKEQISKVEKIKKERKEVQDEAEDWQANLDNWKSSRRKLQEHIIERVVEVKKFEQDDPSRARRKSKTFNEILEERGKSKYSIPIYIDESNDWSDYGISESKSDRIEDDKNNRQNEMGASNEYSNADYSTEIQEMSTSAAQFSSKLRKMDVKYNNNDYNAFTSQIETKPSIDSSKNGQYTYEGAIEGYRSRIKTKIDDSLFIKNSDTSKRTVEMTEIVPKGEICKRKGLFDKQLTDDNLVPNSAARVLQDFENPVSIKQRLKSLEKCTDQTVKYVDNVNFIPKVKQISQLFDKPCIDNVNNYNKEITQNNNYPQRREKLNINIVPWEERETTTTETTDIFMYMNKNDLKEIGSQSDDKSSDTFYSGLEDSNYPPSISSTDYMALSSDREDSGIHTADVSCSVSQADDTAEDQESNANSHDDFHSRQKYYKSSEDINLLGNRILKLSRENISSANIESDDEPNVHYDPNYEKDNISMTVMFIEKLKQDASDQTEEETVSTNNEIDKSLICTKSNVCSDSKTESFSPVITEEIPKPVNINKQSFDSSSEDIVNSDPIKISSSFSSDLNDQEYIFDSDFPLLPTKMIEPPKVKPPPPPVLEDDRLVEPGVKRINSTKRIKKEITLKRSNFLGLNDYENIEFSKGNSNGVPDNENFTIEDTLSKQINETNISDSCSEEHQVCEFKVDQNGDGKSCDDYAKVETEVLDETKAHCQEDEIVKREREIIEMVEKAEKFRDLEQTPETPVPKPSVRLSHSSPAKRAIEKPADASYYDKEAELRRLQDQKNYPGWQQSKHSSEQTIPNFIQRGPITQSASSARSSVRKLTSIDNQVQQYIDHHQPISSQLPDPQPRSIAAEESQNRILSVSGKKKCSFCGNELGRGAAMIIETLCLFYHMECFKCCVCHVQLGNGLNGTDVRVRNQKLHCHNCYSSDDGVKFSCV